MRAKPLLNLLEADFLTPNLASWKLSAIVMELPAMLKEKSPQLALALAWILEPPTKDLALTAICCIFSAKALELKEEEAMFIFPQLEVLAFMDMLSAVRKLPIGAAAALKPLNPALALTWLEEAFMLIELELMFDAPLDLREAVLFMLTALAFIGATLMPAAALGAGLWTMLAF
jgi:hypothetical protein